MDTILGKDLDTRVVIVSHIEILNASVLSFNADAFVLSLNADVAALSYNADASDLSCQC